jgi:hypothetical protein
MFQCFYKYTFFKEKYSLRIVTHVCLLIQRLLFDMCTYIYIYICSVNYNTLKVFYFYALNVITKRSCCFRLFKLKFWKAQLL